MISGHGSGSISFPVSIGVPIADGSLTVYPHTEVFNYTDWPQQEGNEMQFRLTYQGMLPAASVRNKRSTEKHVIRKEFHKQLRRLWDTQPFLKTSSAEKMSGFANNYSRCGYRFLPLICDRFAVACSLDILFLRRDPPGNVIQGGDIDNRIKVLFDSLRTPQTCDEVEGFLPESDEDPFFCLLEDDHLISEVKITTDFLLARGSGTEHKSDVHLVIHVKTLLVGPSQQVAYWV